MVVYKSVVIMLKVELNCVDAQIVIGRYINLDVLHYRQDIKIGNNLIFCSNLKLLISTILIEKKLLPISRKQRVKTFKRK